MINSRERRGLCRFRPCLCETDTGDRGFRGPTAIIVDGFFPCRSAGVTSLVRFCSVARETSFYAFAGGTLFAFTMERTEFHRLVGRCALVLTAQKPLLALCANEIMSRDLVLVPQEMSVQGAARLLSRAQVTGAPVVDAQGCCVGVLSATDFVHWVERGAPVKSAKDSNSSICSAWQLLEEDASPQTFVRNVMTKNPVTATEGVSIGKLAQMMLDAHIHRVIVVDQHERPVGIVTSTDILAAVARADHTHH